MKTVTISVILLIASYILYKEIPTSIKDREKRITNDTTYILEKLRAKAKEAASYCKTKKISEDFCILIDMSLHSGLKRFYVWDFDRDTILRSFLVSHGCGNNSWSGDGSKDSPRFSNVDGSHCSSLGKYKLGERAYSDWGIHVKYMMHGLESSNSNALPRQIVFHSWDKVSDTEIYPAGTPEGWGCPCVSNNAMKWIDPKLQASIKPVLMWIFI